MSETNDNAGAGLVGRSSDTSSDTKTGSDAPQPPGGPQRNDQPGGASDASAEELTRDLQEQNAETSLDQPSDGSGGE